MFSAGNKILHTEKSNTQQIDLEEELTPLFRSKQSSEFLQAL